MNGWTDVQSQTVRDSALSKFVCDYQQASMTISGNRVWCEQGKCPHFGNCLPVRGIRTPTQEAIGDAYKKGNYYHNLIREECDYAEF